MKNDHYRTSLKESSGRRVPLGRFLRSGSSGNSTHVYRHDVGDQVETGDVGDPVETGRRRGG